MGEWGANPSDVTEKSREVRTYGAADADGTAFSTGGFFGPVAVGAAEAEAEGAAEAEAEGSAEAEGAAEAEAVGTAVAGADAEGASAAVFAGRSSMMQPATNRARKMGE